MKATMRPFDSVKAASRSGFTLIEMLVVVVILGILMSIVFRLGNLNEDTSKVAKTIVRLQKLENCLSGYYAAFGSYPPVKVYGSRDITTLVNESGDQTSDADQGNSSEPNSTQIEAACRAQPVAAEYPDEDDNNDGDEFSYIKKQYEVYAQAQAKMGKSVQATCECHSYSNFRHDDLLEKDSDAIVFRFGLMSYLLPRFLFMTVGEEEFYEEDTCRQWSDNNDVGHNAMTGEEMSWSGSASDSVCDIVKNSSKGTSVNQSDIAKVANMPTQAVCARWIPNLEKICYTYVDKTFFGIAIKDPDAEYITWENPPLIMHQYPGSKTKYAPAIVTVCDGFGNGNQFYYYSLPPYQSYVLWSAGPDMNTFPPWIPLNSIKNNTQKRTYAKWLSDDIVKMSH